MNCPKCHSTEINSAGVCLVCGFRTRNVTAPEEPSQEETALHPGTAISAGNRSPSELLNRSEIPPWRLELSKRLREIKLRREAAGELPSAVEPDDVPPSTAGTKSRPEEQRPASPRFLVQHKRRTARVSESSPPSAADEAGVQAQVPVPVSRVEESRIPEDTGVPLPAEDVLLHPSNSAPTSRDKQDIQKLIDSVMAQQASLERTAPPPIDIEMRPTAAAIKEIGGPAPPMTLATPAEEAPSTAPQTEPPASTTEIVAAAPESELPAMDTVALQMGIAEPQQIESAAIAEDTADLRMAMAAALETATPEPEYPALQAEAAAPPAAMAAALETGTPETEPATLQAETAAPPAAMAAALETGTTETEPAALQAETAAPPPAMAAALETATPEPEYPALQAETSASPAAIAAALETGTPETEPAALQAETAAPPPAMAAALETATPEPEYPALQAETSASPAAIAAALETGTPETEPAALQAETAAPPPAMAAALETATPEPEYPALRAETSASPAAMAAALETGTPETVHVALQAETAAAPPEIPEPPSELAAAVPVAVMQAPEIAVQQTKAAATPTETPAPPTAPEEVARETATPAPERAANQEISVAPSKKAATPPMERAAQAPESPPPPKMILPPPQTPPPLPKTVAPVPKPAIPATEYSASLAPPAIFSHITSKPRENKLILLSRTLAGLVDLIIIIISGSALIFTVDVLEGIDVFDGVSITHYLMLLLVTYFVYSLFFLSTGTQTMGMMLTDLRLVGTTMKRPKITQILVRCIAFLLGLAAFGVGLLWGFFDRQSRCLHDWLSQTRVERISS